MKIKDYRMSYFDAPVRNRVPAGAVSVQQLHAMIVGDATLKRLTEEVRSAADYKLAKTTRLPFVTPCGEFAVRKCEGLRRLSGVLPLDIDGLESQADAEALRQRLFDDRYLEPVLCFVSPGGRGVKMLVPYDIDIKDFACMELGTEQGLNPALMAELVKGAITLAMDYVETVYGSCDRSGSDVTRSCFLCHDAGALMRVEQPKFKRT